MTIDWHLVVQLALPVATLFLGAWINRWFERRPVLTSYYGHISAFKFAAPDGNKVDVYTHSVVLRNAGRMSAKNVRIVHTALPEFVIFPAVEYTVVTLPDGGKEILIPSLVPSEQITISYLYGPPLTYAGINSGIKSDEGFAKQIPVLLQRQLPRWVNVLTAILVSLGLMTAVSLAALAIKHSVR